MPVPQKEETWLNTLLTPPWRKKCLEFVLTLQMAYTLSLEPRRLSFKADHFPIEATTPIFPQDLFERWLEVKQQLYSRNKKKRIGWKVILVTRLRCTEQIQFTTITNATDEVLDLPYDSKHHGIISILSAIQFIFWRIKFISNCQTLPSRGKFSPLNNSASQMWIKFDYTFP